MGENVQTARVENRRPSDVFLALWRERATSGKSDLGEFAELADVWAQIREMEAMTAGERLRQELRRMTDFWTDQPAGIRAEQAPPLQTESAETAPEPVSESDPPEAPPAKARDDEAIGKAAFATRKRKAMERLDAVLAAGVTRQEVADAGRGLTITDVMNVLDLRPLPVTVWAKLEKALDALEAKRAPEAPPEGD